MKEYVYNIASTLPVIHAADTIFFSKTRTFSCPSGLNSILAVNNGTGTAYVNEQSHTVKKSSIFLLMPGQSIRLKPAKNITVTEVRYAFPKPSRKTGKFSGDVLSPEMQQCLGNELTQQTFFELTASIFIHEPLKKTVTEYKTKGHGWEVYCGLFVLQALLQLCRCVIFEKEKKNIQISKDYDLEIKMVTEVRKYIRENFRHEIDHKELFAKYQWHINTCRTIFKKHTGIPVSKYQLNIRMNEACRLLVKTKLPIREIAEKTGFSDYYYFLKRFKKSAKKTPSEIRNSKKLNAVLKMLHQ